MSDIKQTVTDNQPAITVVDDSKTVAVSVNQPAVGLSVDTVAVGVVANDFNISLEVDINTFTSIEVDGTEVSTNSPTLDFDGGDFLLTESPTDDFDITVKDSGIDHDATTNFVSNEHIDHTSVTLTAGAGIATIGDISVSRTIAVDRVLEDLDTLGPNAADSEFLVGTGAGALAWENGATARTSLNVDVAGTDNSTNVTLAGTPNYLTLSGQQITLAKLDISDDTNFIAGTGLTLSTNTVNVNGVLEDLNTLGVVASNSQMIVGTGSGAFAYESGATLRTSIGVDAAGTDNSTNVTLAGTPNYLTLSAQEITLTKLDITDDTNFIAGAGLTLSTNTVNIDSSNTVQTSLANLVTVGALDSGSITSGFGGIDIGSSTFATTGALNVQTIDSLAANLNITANSTGELTINDAGEDVNFRVEGNGVANMIKVDAGNNQCGIGVAPVGFRLHVAMGGTMGVFKAAGTSSSQFSIDMSPVNTSSVTNCVGLFISPFMDGTAGADTMNGISFSPQMRPAGNIVSGVGLSSILKVNTTNNITNLSSNNHRIDTLAGSSGTITVATVFKMLSPILAGSKPATMSGMIVENQGLSGITNTRGIVIEEQSGSTNNWNLLSEGAATINILEGLVGIGNTTVPTSPLQVDQDSLTGAVPVLVLDQADISEEMIEFVTTIGTGNAIEAIAAKTLTTTHFIKVTIPGGLTRYIPCGTIA